MLNPLSSDIRFMLGSIGIILGVLAGYSYVYDTMKRNAKPHAFSWFIWTALSGIIFAIQLRENGGFGSYVTGLAAIVSGIMTVLGFLYGSRAYRPIDFASLGGAGIALILWTWTKDPTASTVLLSFINAVGFVPSVRKILTDPFSETIRPWGIVTVRGFLGIAALVTVNFNTAFFAFTNALENLLFIALILFIRQSKKS